MCIADTRWNFVEVAGDRLLSDCRRGDNWSFSLSQVYRIGARSSTHCFRVAECVRHGQKKRRRAGIPKTHTVLETANVRRFRDSRFLRSSCFLKQKICDSTL